MNLALNFFKILLWSALAWFIYIILPVLWVVGVQIVTSPSPLHVKFLMLFGITGISCMITNCWRNKPYLIQLVLLGLALVGVLLCMAWGIFNWFITLGLISKLIIVIMASGSMCAILNTIKKALGE